RVVAIADAEWNPIGPRLLSIEPAAVVPMYVAGKNGPMFQIAGMLHPALRTALLGRELLNKRGRRIEVHVGSPIPAEKLLAVPTPREQADYLRWRTHLLGAREAFKPRTALPLSGRRTQGRSAPFAAAVPVADVAAEIAGLPASSLLGRSGDLQVYLARAI